MRDWLEKIYLSRKAVNALMIAELTPGDGVIEEISSLSVREERKFCMKNLAELLRNTCLNNILKESALDP